MPRLFIYAAEAHQKQEPERSILIRQLQLMQHRLWYIITWPSAIITLIMGALLLSLQPGFLQAGWMHIKLAFVAGLYVYHYSLHRIFKQQQQNTFKYNSNQLRIWNEVATIFLFAIVFLVVVQTNLSWLAGIGGLFVLVILLMLGIRLYKRVRER